MTQAEKWIVITTINPPTETIKAVSALCASGEWSAVVVGDSRTPSWTYPFIEFLGVDDQRSEFPNYSERIPYRHYSRKNLGYLHAIRRGAAVILETDDDNNPFPTFGVGLNRSVTGRRLIGTGWVNIYPHFLSTGEGGVIWPRGLPLDAIHCTGSVDANPEVVACPIQQYLADTDPDVDAIYRLINKAPVYFNKDVSPVIIGKDTWVPFNSQNTVFFREAFPLLYLPCHVSFRMTDIWRSFVAQAALTAKGCCWSFHPPTVAQDRNAHDLIQDFSEEVVGYLKNREIGELLGQVVREMTSRDSISTIAKSCWNALADAGIVSREKELPLITQWYEELDSVMRPS